jgi:hypothetical protein
MNNLKGDEGCDKCIERELTRCRIEVVRGERSTRDVPASITGKLGAFMFSRAWYYWVVEGPMPLDVAMKLWADPVGKTDIRSGGHCCCLSPEEYGTDYFDADGKRLCSDPDGKEAAKCVEFISRGILPADSCDDIRFVPDKRVGYARAEVRSYHVDSELGLYILAEAIRGLEKDKAI